MSQTRPEKQRTRTLTGCYTCRERKLKCDDTRPACRRCIALGVECQGYEVKLSWLAYNQDRPRAKETDAESDRTRSSTKGKKNSPSEPALRRRPLFSGRPQISFSLFPLVTDDMAHRPRKVQHDPGGTEGVPRW